jgi:SagB-type dehydrogenase family enzyme
LSIASAGALLQLSVALSAWKQHGPDRWALRCNPSSGNLHPTEAYVLCNNVPGLADGLHHYFSRDHLLEQRCRAANLPGAPARLWIGLSSIHWREAWKYGERAFRYCQLDIGHALGAFRYAAGALGWTARLIDAPSRAVAALIGVDRAKDFTGAEPEDPEVLIAIEPGQEAGGIADLPSALPSALGPWTGHANLLDPHPLYRWPIIDEVSRATHGRDGGKNEPPPYPALRHATQARAVDIIQGRRSAQRFDSKFRMHADVFCHLLDCLLVRPTAPWDVWSFAPCLHPIIFVHRVEGLEPGIYALPRHPHAASALRQALQADFEWQRLENVPAHLPLFRLVQADCRGIARTVNCHQAIASDSCFALSLLSELEDVVRLNPWRYRQIHWEAGLLGHILYLEAEAAGLRGTGIGCFFDDALHELLGLTTTGLQALYGFTIGRPLTDERLATMPAYPDR